MFILCLFYFYRKSNFWWSGRIPKWNRNVKGCGNTSQHRVLLRLLHHTTAISNDHGVCGSWGFGNISTTYNLKINLCWSLQLTYLRTVRHGSTKFKPNGDVSYANREKAEQTKPKVKYIELKLSSQSVDSECETERQPKTSIAES